MLTTGAGFSQPTVGTLNALLLVIGKGTFECEGNVAYFRQMNHAPVYEIGSLYYTDKSRFDALKDRRVFAMERPPRGKVGLEDYLSPFRLIMLSNFHLDGGGFRASLYTHSAYIKPDLGGTGTEARQRAGDRASSVGQDDKMAVNIGPQSDGRRTSSGLGQRAGGTGRSGIRANEMAHLPKADLGGTDTEARRQKGLRSGQDDILAVNPRQNRGGQRIGSNAGQRTNGDGRNGVGVDTMARLPIDQSAAKLRKRAAQAGSSPNRRLMNLFGNDFFPSPYSLESIEAEQYETAEKSKWKSKPEMPGGGIWARVGSQMLNVDGQFPLGHWPEKEGIEVFMINPVGGVPTSCADVASKRRQFEHPVAFQLAVFRRGCKPGLSDRYATPPLFCASPNSGCPNTREGLQAGHRAFLNKVEAEKRQEAEEAARRSMYGDAREPRS